MRVSCWRTLASLHAARTCAGLAVGEDCAVEAVEDLLDDGLDALLIEHGLRRLRPKHLRAVAGQVSGADAAACPPEMIYAANCSHHRWHRPTAWLCCSVAEAEWPTLSKWNCRRVLPTLGTVTTPCRSSQSTSLSSAGLDSLAAKGLAAARASQSTWGGAFIVLRAAPKHAMRVRRWRRDA